MDNSPISAVQEIPSTLATVFIELRTRQAPVPTESIICPMRPTKVAFSFKVASTDGTLSSSCTICFQWMVICCLLLFPMRSIPPNFRFHFAGKQPPQHLPGAAACSHLILLFIIVTFPSAVNPFPRKSDKKSARFSAHFLASFMDFLCQAGAYFFFSSVNAA